MSSFSLIPLCIAWAVRDLPVNIAAPVSAGNILDEDLDKIAESLRLMRVFVANANCKANPPMKPWQAAQVTDMTAWSRTGGATEFNYFIDCARTEYVSGAVAVHIDCSGEGLLGQFFQQASCPYALAKEWQTPAALDGTSPQQIRGLSLGARQLAVLALAAEKARLRPSSCPLLRVPATTLCHRRTTRAQPAPAPPQQLTAPAFRSRLSAMSPCRARFRRRRSASSERRS